MCGDVRNDCTSPHSLIVSEAELVLLCCVMKKDIYLDYRPDDSHPYAYVYPRPSVTADCILFAQNGEGVWHVLLIRRGGEPFRGFWAFPGGFLEAGHEDTEQCARRELTEETGLQAGSLSLVGVYSRPERDPRCHIVTASYCGIVPMQAARGLDDAADARWFPLDAIPPLAFDHADMLQAARAKLEAGELR